MGIQAIHASSRWNWKVSRQFLTAILLCLLLALPPMAHGAQSEPGQVFDGLTAVEWENIQAQISADVPQHVYRLQYSYNGRIWHDLTTIKDGDLAQNVRYLDRGRGMPSLRYWYSYLDEEGLRRVQYIPLTISEAP